jgi:hypothetical protein
MPICIQSGKKKRKKKEKAHGETRPTPFFRRTKRVQSNLRYRAENISPTRQKLRAKRVGSTDPTRFATLTVDHLHISTAALAILYEEKN